MANLTATTKNNKFALLFGAAFAIVIPSLTLAYVFGSKT